MEQLIKMIRAKLSYFFATQMMRDRWLVKLKCPHCQSIKESFPIGSKNTLMSCAACGKFFYVGAIYLCNGDLEKLNEFIQRVNYRISEYETNDSYKDLQR